MVCSIAESLACCMDLPASSVTAAEFVVYTNHTIPRIDGTINSRKAVEILKRRRNLPKGNRGMTLTPVSQKPLAFNRRAFVGPRSSPQVQVRLCAETI